MVSAPAPWLARWGAGVAAGAAVLDIAAGKGRHSNWFVARGHPVTAVDRDVSALPRHPALTAIAADLEAAPWPLAGRRFAAVAMINYLWRPLWPDLLAAVAPGGLLIAETFAMGNEAFGRPRNPAFLLRPGELLTICQGAGFDVLGYAHGRVATASGGHAIRQGICARA